MSTPYYQDDRVTLYHGDCLEVTEWLSADVLVTDPPYGTASGKRGADGYGRREARESSDPDKPRVIANDETTETRDQALAMWGTRPALLFGSPRLPDPPGAWADRLVWDKRRPGINGGPWRYRHESIYVTAGFVRTSDASVSILGKPLGLMSALVEAAPAGVIADPFAGSGSTLVAAARMGRSSIGVEIEERYCEVIARRLDQGVLDFGGALA